MVAYYLLPIIRSRPRVIFLSMLSLCLVIGIIVLIQVQFSEFRSFKVSLGSSLFQQRSRDNQIILKSSNPGIPGLGSSSHLTNNNQKDHADEHVDLHSAKDNHSLSGNIKAASHIHNKNIDPKSVAIGCAVTSRGVRGLPNVAAFPLFRNLLPSFCKTASHGWNYHIYISHDHNDAFFAEADQHNKFEMEFYNMINSLCGGISVKLHFVRCSHSGNPAWAQNDAMIEAYIDNMAYYYRINDDTVIQDRGWTEAFSTALGKYIPANVGVVGPNHRGGNEAILTYDFVHHTHVTIFGFYYPRIFTDWFADDWVTKVYQPGRSTKMQNYRLVHTMSTGTRYNVRAGKGELLPARLEMDRKVLQRYLKAIESEYKPLTNGKKIISMSLYGDDSRYTWGAIRNAQILSVFLPGWTMRVYIEKPRANGSVRYAAVPVRIINKLKTLGAQIAYVDVTVSRIPPMMWRFLVADDLNIDYFIIRDSDSRFSDRDATVVGEWVKSGKPFHCVRDHPSHSSHPIFGGLWGGKPKELLKVFGKSFEDMLREPRWNSIDYGHDLIFLSKVVWPMVKDIAYCHDSVSCKQYPSSHPFPVVRVEQEHIGQTFNMFGEGSPVDIDILKKSAIVKECTDPSSILPGPVPGIPTEPPPVSLSKIDRDVIIWSVDLRIGPIQDVRNILEPAGVKFVDKSMSKNCNRTKSCGLGLKVLTKKNIHETSPTVIEEFYMEYKNNPEMQKVTTFLCSYPAANCELYIKFNKPMIVLVAGRYEYGRLQSSNWKAWNKSLKQIKNGNKNIIATTNSYDKAYINYYTGIDPELIPSLCAYTNTTYLPSKSEFLVAPLTVSTFQEDFLKNFEHSRSKHVANTFLHVQADKLPQYTFKELASYMGIIYIPNDAFSIYLCEIYHMNIPIFAPSLSLLVDIWQRDWKLLSSRTLNYVRKLSKSNNTILPAYKSSGGDPNNEKDLKIVKEWMSLADVYQYPHIILFDTIEDLVVKLKTENLVNISRQMKKVNLDRRKQILKKWKDVLQQTAGVSTSIS